LRLAITPAITLCCIPLFEAKMNLGLSAATLAFQGLQANFPALR
jgi:hypothetical protein